MKDIAVVVPGFGAGPSICYTTPFEILQARGLIAFRMIMESEFNIDNLSHIEVLVLYRCTHGKTLSLARLARKRRIKVIYEIDDDLMNPPLNQTWAQRYVKNGLTQVIDMFFAEVDLIKVGSEVLASRIKQRGYMTVYQPYAVKMRNVDKVLNSVHCIGYFGTLHHRDDIASIFEALLLVEKRLGERVTFEFIGCYPSNWRLLRNASILNYEPSYDLFLDKLAARGWAIGLAPLCASPFNQAKSNSKFRDYTAAGIPGIYTDLEPYASCIVHGENGWLCGANPQEWANTIVDALEDIQGRRRVLSEAREYITRRHDPDVVADNWGVLLESVCGNILYI